MGKFEKNFKWISSHSDMSVICQSLKWYVKCAIKSENQQNQHRLCCCITFHAKRSQRSPDDKVEWKQNYLNWNICYIKKKKFKWKAMLNQGTLSCYKNLPKKLQSFLCVIVTSLSPKSVTSGVYNAFPQTT